MHPEKSDLRTESVPIEVEGDADDNSTPWGKLGQRWGHPWHAMCSYLGTYPAALARSLISLLSEEGDVVMDPFSGRGTTLLEARLLNRHAVVSDLNPMAIALSKAKNANVNRDDVIAELEQLRSSFDRVMYLPEAHVQGDDIQLIYSPETLAQLCYLRRRLSKGDSQVRDFLLGALLGVMHGAERQDGSSAYASISMPNTFSMAPNYVRRFVETKQLNRIGRDVFGILSEKIERLFKSAPPSACRGLVAAADAKKLASVPDFIGHHGKVKLVVTSPPYLGVVNYAKQNWIRNWLLERTDYYGREAELDDNLSLPSWIDFIEQTIAQLDAFLTDDGVIALVVGDVASTKSHINLARHLIQRLLHNGAYKYVGVLDDHIDHEIKTTRIWKETKGRATEVDRIIVLSKVVPTLNVSALAASLSVDLAQVAAYGGMDAEALAENARFMAGRS